MQTDPLEVLAQFSPKSINPENLGHGVNAPVNGNEAAMVLAGLKRGPMAVAEHYISNLAHKTKIPIYAILYNRGHQLAYDKTHFGAALAGTCNYVINSKWENKCQSCNGTGIRQTAKGKVSPHLQCPSCKGNGDYEMSVTVLAKYLGVSRQQCYDVWIDRIKRIGLVLDGFEDDLRDAIKKKLKNNGSTLTLCGNNRTIVP